MSASDGSGRQHGLWQVGDWCVDMDRRRITRAGETLEVPDRSFHLFAALFAAAPETVTTDALMDAVWGRTVVSDETLKQRVMLLRRALGEGADDLILTDRGRGYRMAEIPRPVAATDAGRAASSGRYRRAGIVALLVMVASVAAYLGYPNREIGSPTPTAATDQPTRPVSVEVGDIWYLSNPGGADFFAENLRDGLLTHFANLDGVRVQRDGGPLPEAVAQEMGIAARLLVEGSFQKAGDQARVVVRIEDLGTGQLLWAREFTVPVSPDRRLASQRRISEETSRALADQVSVLVADRRQPPYR